MNYQLKRIVCTALYNIASASPDHGRAVLHRQDKQFDELSRKLTSEWRLPGQALLWAIYERSVLDYLGVGGHRIRTIREKDATAVTGNIKTASGKIVNILVELNIRPAWAWGQIQKAVNYTKMKEAA
jgi:hypothetical protein